MFKQLLVIYGAFVCCASISGDIGNYAVQSFWKHVLCTALLIFLYIAILAYSV
jgi:hypothetical protein